MFDPNRVLLWCCCLFACTVLSFAEDEDEYCPPQEMISPCVCKSGFITALCTGIEQMSVLKRVFRNTLDRPLPWLLLEDAALMYFPAEALNRKKIRKLIIRRSYLVTVFDREVEENFDLTHLRLIDTKVLRGIDWRLFHNFRNLMRLEINGTQVGKLGKEFRDNVPASLGMLMLVNSKRAWLADRVFDKLTLATELHVTGGKISTLKRSMFPKKDNWLSVLNFNNNRISNLPNDIFSDMNRLETVWMRGNRFTTISQSVFGNFFGILDLNDNKIECGCDIRWIMRSNNYRLSRLGGTCDSPANYKGKPIKEIPQEHFKYCDFTLLPFLSKI